MNTLHKLFGQFVFIFLFFTIVFALLFWPVHYMRKALFVPHAAAQEELTFHPQIEDTTIKLQIGTIWQLPDGPDYKNERLREYQKMLRARGIINRKDLRLFAAQLLQENGAIAEDRHGDDGCSVGIPQRNVCQFGYTAESFVKKYPEWQDWRFQLEWMADYTAKQYKLFNGVAKCTIIYHNRPASALAGCRDTAAGYFKSITAKAALLTL